MNPFLHSSYLYSEFFFYFAHHPHKFWHAFTRHRLSHLPCLAPEEFWTLRNGRWSKKVIHHRTKTYNGSDQGKDSQSIPNNKLLIPIGLNYYHCLCRVERKERARLKNVKFMGRGGDGRSVKSFDSLFTYFERVQKQVLRLKVSSGSCNKLGQPIREQFIATATTGVS